MVPEPKPNPNNPIPKLPLWTVALPGINLATMTLNTASAAWDLFGSDDKSDSASPGFRGGGGRFGEAPGHEGTAADAEQEAAKKLSERTETLKSLDAQLKAIGDQIIDGNSEKKKRIEAIAGVARQRPPRCPRGRADQALQQKQLPKALNRGRERPVQSQSDL